MKKILLLIAISFTFLASKAQPKVDTTKEAKDTAVTVTLTLQEYKVLVALINKSEESHRVVSYYLDLLNDKRRVEFKLFRKKQ